MGRATDLTDICPQCLEHGCKKVDGTCKLCKECNYMKKKQKGDIEVYGLGGNDYVIELADKNTLFKVFVSKKDLEQIREKINEMFASRPMSRRRNAEV